jgi:hypothetical protein
VLDVTMDRWHRSQSDADRRINKCAMVTAFGTVLLGRRWQFDWVCLVRYLFSKKFTIIGSLYCVYGHTYIQP